MEHIDPLMGVILPYANFFLFLFLAWYFFRRPVIAAAKKRREDFEKLMAEATRAKQNAEEQLAVLNRRLALIDKEVLEIRTMTKNAADEEAQKIVSEAESLAERLKQEARRLAAAEVEKARAQLRQEIVSSVRDAVTKKIQSELDTNAQLSLVKKQISDLSRIRVEG